MASEVVLDNVASGTKVTKKSGTGKALVRCSGGSVLIKLDVDTAVSPHTGTTYETVIAGEGVEVTVTTGDFILLEAASASTTVSFGDLYNR